MVIVKYKEKENKKKKKKKQELYGLLSALNLNFNINS